MYSIAQKTTVAALRTMNVQTVTGVRNSAATIVLATQIQSKRTPATAAGPWPIVPKPAPGMNSPFHRAVRRIAFSSGGGNGGGIGGVQVVVVTNVPPDWRPA